MLKRSEIVLVSIVLFSLTILCDGGKGKVKPQPLEQQEESVVVKNYEGAVFIYPKGMRSERDIPVCSKWIPKLAPKDEKNVENTEGFQSDQGATTWTAGDFGFLNGTGANDIFLEKQSEGGEEQDNRWESSCNIVHKRFFYPPVVERLCRCPDRTECPWEWKQPPSYPDSPAQGNGTKGSRDPYTIMLSNRSQAKFCTEVSTVLPRCQNANKEKPKGDNESLGKIASLVKTVRKANTGDEIPTITANCYCPPLYRQWNYVGQTERTNFTNGTYETIYYYNCNRLTRCRTKDMRCGNIRTDQHFSFYHCTCPRKQLCLPKKYPVEPDDTENSEKEVHEVLYIGQVAPAFCTPFSE